MKLWKVMSIHMVVKSPRFELKNQIILMSKGIIAIMTYIYILLIRNFAIQLCINHVKKDWPTIQAETHRDISSLTVMCVIFPKYIVFISNTSFKSRLFSNWNVSAKFYLPDWLLSSFNILIKKILYNFKSISSYNHNYIHDF